MSIHARARQRRASAVGGFIGAFFALPVAAIVQAFVSTYSRRYDVVESDLTKLDTPKPRTTSAVTK